MTSTYDEIAWDKAKSEAKEILSDCAHRGKTITYSIFVSKICAISFDLYSAIFSSFLAEISQEEYFADRGMLTVLVVHNDDEEMPGPGFFELAEKLGYQFTDKDEFWIKEYRKVCCAWGCTEL